MSPDREPNNKKWAEFTDGKDKTDRRFNPH